ncbi:MAG: hypothetical protein C4519_01060 [Desulfobacteraceae bacterium]|nr:MAG: hypothetical protein C4519_01060 [Desulfobacteraceae bacterium]
MNTVVRFADSTFGSGTGWWRWKPDISSGIRPGGRKRKNNGLALCCVHHKLFDLGVLTLSDAMTVMVSEEAHGTAGFH